MLTQTYFYFIFNHFQKLYYMVTINGVNESVSLAFSWKRLEETSVLQHFTGRCNRRFHVNIKENNLLIFY